MAANPCISKVLFCSAVVDAVRSGGGGSKGFVLFGPIAEFAVF